MGKNKKPVPVEYDECRAHVIFKPSTDSLTIVKEYVMNTPDGVKIIHSELHDFGLKTMSLQTALSVACTFVQNMSLVEFVSDEEGR